MPLPSEFSLQVSGRTLPSGAIAFMFTDIEGSTVRWDRDPQAMQTALRDHDVLMRAAIGEHGGHVFKTIGDAFCAVFETVHAALDAAVAAQRALEAHDFSAVDGIRVRMAVHFGTSDERDGDYYGPTLNRVARLLATGHGGQIIVSDAVFALSTGETRADRNFLPLGQHRLKDLSEPETIYQVVAPGLRQTFPPLTSLSVTNTNLPLQLTELFGREQQIADVSALLRTSRLVTLFGMGGLGKTRCAQHVGVEMLTSFRDGAWFIDLAPVAAPELVPNAVASALGLQESANRSMAETLTAHLRTKQLLLIVDNCEHLIAPCADLAAQLLNACPKISILATSREALRIAGEQVYNVPPLPVSDAVALFAARAQAIVPTFALNDANAASVAEICRRLDGLPLAIELAAARSRVLPPQQLVQKLDERFRILTGGARTALPRQQTLRALIDWSYDLLDEADRRIFRHAACFAGSFPADLTAVVCGDDQFDVLDRLASLTEKSLVVGDTGYAEMRFHLLESIRAYAAEKLAAAGEADAARRRHARAYAERAERLKADYEIESHDVWLHATEVELENLRAALHTAFAPDGEVLVGQRIAATLDRLFITSASVEASRWVETAQARIDEQTPAETIGRLALAEAGLAAALNRFRAARAAADRASTTFSALADERGVADADRLAARALIRLGDPEAAEPMLHSALATFRRLGVQRSGGILRDLAVISGIRGDLLAAREWFERALAVFRESADEENAAITAGALAEVEFHCGLAHEAVAHAEEGLATVRAMGRDRVVAAFEGNIAAYLNALGEHARAAERAAESLTVARDAGAAASVAFALQHLAAARIAGRTPMREAVEQSVRLLGFVDARLGALDVVREFTEEQEYRGAVAAAGKHLGSDRTGALMEEGGRWPESSAIAAATALMPEQET